MDPQRGPAGPHPVFEVGLRGSFGNLSLLYRDPAIGSHYPLPIRPRARPTQVCEQVQRDGPQEAEMLVLNVYQGLGTIPRGTIKRPRIVGMPLKPHRSLASLRPPSKLTPGPTGSWPLDYASLIQPVLE